MTQLREVDTVDKVLHEMENNKLFRSEFYTMVDHPPEVAVLTNGQLWESLEVSEKKGYAAFVLDLIHDEVFGEPHGEAQETAYREAIGYPVGSIIKPVFA